MSSIPSNQMKPGIQLTSRSFGAIYVNELLEAVTIYTWKSQNKVEVEVITYGARIHAIRYPDRKGKVEDVVLGFEDVAGYIYYSDQYMNSLIGPVVNLIENGTFVVEDRQHIVSKNFGEHSYNGGYYGLDKCNFQSYQSGNKVIMSKVIPDGVDGYPGDMMVVITFELNVRNEFKTTIEAFTTKPTICNISNRVHFNLAGSTAGPEGLYQHVVQINANCYTLMSEDKPLPTGNIRNVVHTKFDLQVPTRIGSLIGMLLDDGYNQNLCINRGVDQDNCFAARIVHPQSGRVLEIYTNQPGLQFYTADDLGTGKSEPSEDEDSIGMSSIEQKMHSDATRTFFALVDRLHKRLLGKVILEDHPDYKRLRVLIAKLIKCEKFGSHATTISETLFERDDPLTMHSPDFHAPCLLTPIEIQYLLELKNAAEDVSSVTDYSDVKLIVEKLLTNNYSETDYLEIDRNELDEYIAAYKVDHEQPKSASPDVSEKETTHIDRRPTIERRLCPTVCAHEVPTVYKDGKVHGRFGCVYQRHGAFCMQTQNYPNAIYHKNFPDSVLRPGEKYTHTIVYKFWVQPGNPVKYNHRISKEIKKFSLNK